MNETLNLPATLRDPAKKANTLRATRQIPAEYYGKGKDNLHLALDYQTFRKVYRAAGGSSIINLVVEGEKSPREVLVHTVDYNPLTDEFFHIDLMQIDRSKKIITKVPIHLLGESPAVKNLGGLLNHGKTEIEIKCLPKDLLNAIEIDISGMAEIGALLRVKDLTIDRTTHEVLEEPETMIATILAPKTAEEVEEELGTEVGEAVSEDVKKEAEAEKAAAQASKESDKEKKGGPKEEKK
ncbi:MAG: 50S ribosomal protein L25 [Patescibacteria group bacterium]